MIEPTLAEQWIAAHEAVAAQTRMQAAEAIQHTGEWVLSRLQAGAMLFTCGNGGSAADAQHFAAELTGNFRRRQRRALAAVALTVDSSALTSIGNDFSFEQIFSRQLEGLARPGDMLFGITTSGGSRNVLAAFEAAGRLGVECVALVGEDTSKVAPLCSRVISIPSSETAKVQEMHIMAIHIICEVIDRGMTGE